MARLQYKNPAQLRAMARAGAITQQAIEAASKLAVAGATPLELDAEAERVIREHGAIPNFQLVPGYVNATCIAVNDALVHAIPTSVPLQAGDLVKIDCGAEIDGMNADSAISVIIAGDAPQGVRERAERLSNATRTAMWAGIARLATAKSTSDIGEAVERSIRASGKFGIVREYVGHGIGHEMHESPYVYNHANRAKGAVVKPGLGVAIEPIITDGGITSKIDDDQWTVRTKDGSLGCQWEHTVIVHADGLWVTTAADGGVEGLAPHGIVPVAPR